jgi:hypothetical protein
MIPVTPVSEEEKKINIKYKHAQTSRDPITWWNQAIFGAWPREEEKEK